MFQLLASLTESVLSMLESSLTFRACRELVVVAVVVVVVVVVVAVSAMVRIVLSRTQLQLVPDFCWKLGL